MDLGAGSFNGLAFGPGTKIHVSAISGIDDLPAIRSTDAERGNDDGLFAGRDYYGGRTVVLGMNFIGASRTEYNSLLEQVRAAFQKLEDGAVETPLVVFGNRQLSCRVRDRKVPYDAQRLPTYGDFLAMLVATDPRFYSTTVRTASTGLPASNGGAAWPWAWPISWGSSSGSGSVVVNNAGSARTYPIVTITGPTDNVTIENATLGAKVTFLLSMTNTDTLVIDMRQRTALLNGSSRRAAMTSDSVWWGIQPDSQTPGGAGSTVNYRANTVQTGGLMSLSWRDAWI